MPFTCPLHLGKLLKHIMVGKQSWAWDDPSWRSSCEYVGWSRQRRKPLPLVGVSSIFTAAYSSIQELMVPDPALALPRVTMVEWELVVLQVGEHYIWWDPNNHVASLTESQHSHLWNAAQELLSPTCNLGTYVPSCQHVDVVSRVHTNGYDARTVAGCTFMDEYAHKLTSARFCLIFCLGFYEIDAHYPLLLSVVSPSLAGPVSFVQRHRDVGKPGYSKFCQLVACLC